MPDVNALSLDHAGFMVHDLDRGADKWRKLGFQLLTRSPQIGYVPGQDVMQPWATSNHCAMFEQGYLELIGITDPASFNPWNRFIHRFEGPHIAALRCDEANQAFASLRGRAGGFDPPVQRQRNVSVEGAIQPFRFRNIFSQDEHYPEGRFIIIEHQTPEVIWRPELMAHPNGARALTALVFCAEDPQPTLDRLTAMTGEAAVEGAHGDPTILLRDGGALVVLDDKTFHVRYETSPPKTGPHIAAAIVQVEDMDHMKSLLMANGVPMHRSADGEVWVAPQDANGGVLQFEQS
ncbi:MAG: VOC family protein [Rhodospirillaceae bacterium]|nr:VOC family protein [Rhodospirillaceae bacterium]MBT5811150.1 VOC family protein [Rhodospirillaceae bacterium]